jgi:hypothetical protein
MKASILHLSLALLAAVALASALSTNASGQNPGTGSVESPLPDNLNHLPGGGDATPPADWFTPQTEEERRYLGFFRELRAWDENADHLDAPENSDSSEFSLPRLEKESGLTSSEAAWVRRIVFQYIQDDQDDARIMTGIRNRAIADYPNSWKSIVYSDPEYVNLHKLQSKLLTRAIAQLASILGSKRFTKLDSYTRHYEDRTKASQLRKPAEPSQSGAQM